MSVHGLLVSGTDEQLWGFHQPLCMLLNCVNREQQTLHYACMGEDLPAALEVARKAGVTVEEIGREDGEEGYRMLVRGKHPGWKTEKLAQWLEGARFIFTSEAELQEGIARLLTQKKARFEREVNLSEKDRIDFLLGTVGIEVKIDGSRADVIRQLHRYAQSEKIIALILVTNRYRHTDVPDALNDKPLRVVNISTGGAF